MAPSNSPPKSPASRAVEALNAQIDGALAIVQPFAAFVQDSFAESKKRKTASQRPDAPAGPDSAAWDPPTEFDALALARDAATLTRAHGTKISLLIINEPFTPSAIGKVVQELVNGAVPALAKAVEVCYGDRYTHRVRQELARRCGSVLVQVQHLLEAIPRDGRVIPEEKRSGGGGGGSSKTIAERGSYTKIGILWAECDGIVAFCNLGVRGHLVQTVNQLADMLKDEQEELKEWGEEEDDDDDEDDVDDSGYDDGEGDQPGIEGGAPDNPHDAAQAMLDALMTTRHIPADDPDGLRPRLETVLKKIRLVVLLCRAIVKRRLNKLPALPTKTPTDIAARLDNTIIALQAIANRFEDLAAAFYRLDAREVDATMHQCFEDAFAASEQLARPWTGTQDEFTDWAVKFQAEIRVAPTV